MTVRWPGWAWGIVFVALGLVLMALPGVGVGSAHGAQGDDAVGKANPRYYVVAKTENKCGRKELLRRGYFDGKRGFGFRKMAIKHNIKKPRVWKVVMHKSCGTPREAGATAYIYERTIKRIRCVDGSCWEVARVRVHAVQEHQNEKGLITAYCEGHARCPDWLNTLVLVEPRVGAKYPGDGRWLTVN